MRALVAMPVIGTLLFTSCSPRSAPPSAPGTSTAAPVVEPAAKTSEPAPQVVSTAAPAPPAVAECTAEEQAALKPLEDTPDKTCADVKARLGTTTDGPQVIQPPGRPPLRVWCSGMNTSKPLEYLDLPRTSAKGEKTSNYSELVFGEVHGSQRCPCHSAVTRFEKVRLDPARMEIITTDFTYAEVDRIDSDPACFVDNEAVCSKGWFSAEPLAYGMAAGCQRRATTASANIDLSCTPFHIAPESPFKAVGFRPVGDVHFHPSRKAALIKGGGDCGAFGAVHPEKQPRRPPTFRNIVLERDG